MGKIIFMIIVFSVFTSFSNVTSSKKSFGEEVKANPVVMLKQGHIK